MLQPLLEAGFRQSMVRLVRPVLSNRFPLALQRRYIRQVYRASLPPRSVGFRPDDLGGVQVLRAMPAAPSSGTLIYLHGGGYIMGSASTHKGMAGHLAAMTGCEVIIPDYRLAPEYPFPAAPDDAEAVYLALLHQGIAPSSLAVAGDSAGGGLSLVLAMRLRDRGQPLPSSVVVFSPWTDLTEQHLYGPDCEPVLHADWTAKAARMYAGDVSRSHPLISPVFGNLNGLPPLLVQVGSQEILLNDAVRLAEVAKRDEVETTLEIYNNLWHVFQVHCGQLTRATAAMQRAATHIRAHLAG